VVHDIRRRTVLVLLCAVIGPGFVAAACSSSGNDADEAATEPTTTAAASTASEALGTTESGATTSGLTGRLMFSRFDEGTHTFISTHVARADGSHETELPLPGPEGGGRWSRSGEEIALMTVLPDERIGTAIIALDGTVKRVLEIPDKSLNLVCVVWSPDDSRLACEGWDDTAHHAKGSTPCARLTARAYNG
jgi:hypothetical protein